MTTICEKIEQMGANLTEITISHHFNKVFDGIILALIATVGLFGNVLIILCVCLTRNMKDLTWPFVVNLAVANLIMSCWVVPNTMALTFLPESSVTPLFCKVYGMSIFMMSSALVNFSTVIAVNRYFVILKRNLVRRFLVAKSSFLWCLLVWIYTILQVAVPTVMDLFRYKYNPVMKACHLDYSHFTMGVALYVNCICFAPCVATCTFCYFQILVALHQSRRRLRRHGQQPLLVDNHVVSIDSSSGRRAARERKATMPLFAALIAFLLHWMPIMIVVALDPNFTLLHERIYRYLAMFSLLNVCDNWIIYGALNRNFANGYRKLLCLWTRRRNEATTLADIHKLCQPYDEGPPENRIQQYNWNGQIDGTISHDFPMTPMMTTRDNQVA